MRSAFIIAIKRNWLFCCCLAFCPVLAIFHHAVFFRLNCLLNRVAGEYTLESTRIIILKNPAVLTAVLICTFIYLAGNRWPVLRLLLPLFCISFAPLTLYVLDIPFTNRIVCRYLHDEKMLLFGDVPLKGRYFYIFGTIIFVFLSFLSRKKVFNSLDGDVDRKRLKGGCITR